MKVTRNLFKSLAALAALVAALPAAVPAIAQSAPPTAAPAVAAPAAAEPAKPAQATRDEGYVLGLDDVVEVSLVGQPDFRTRARVETDGTIALPFIGTMKVVGETPLSLSKIIAGKLKNGGYYLNPIVSVDIAAYASRYVIVLGEVATPGLQPVSRAFKVSEILARAGGVRPGAATYVQLRRANGEEMKLSYKALAIGSDENDPIVQAGDKIYVPSAELFYIYGQVNGPGVYPILEGMTLRMALARAGGLTMMGSDKRIKLMRGGAEQKAALDAKILEGDVVVVGDRGF